MANLHLSKLAEDPEIARILGSGVGHVKAAELIHELGSDISEASVRRWRSRNSWVPEIQPPATMKILSLDIETRPNLAWVWELWGEQHISLDQVVEPKSMMSFAAHWYGSTAKPVFASVYHNGKADMLNTLRDLLDNADVALHFNGKRFDIPHIQGEFVLLDWRPPSPFKNIDLYETVKKQFKFPSNKLDYVSQAMGLGSKLHHQGFRLWRDCMEGDPKAWSTMRKYNIQDVLLNERVYDRVLPWIQNHPSYAAFTGNSVCPNCGSSDLIENGFAYTGQSKFVRYECGNCGKACRSSRRLSGASITQIAGG